MYGRRHLPVTIPGREAMPQRRLYKVVARPTPQDALEDVVLTMTTTATAKATATTTTTTTTILLLLFLLITTFIASMTAGILILIKR